VAAKRTVTREETLPLAVGLSFGHLLQEIPCLTAVRHERANGRGGR